MGKKHAEKRRIHISDEKKTQFFVDLAEKNSMVTSHTGRIHGETVRRTYQGYSLIKEGREKRKIKRKQIQIRRKETY